MMYRLINCLAIGILIITAGCPQSEGSEFRNVLFINEFMAANDSSVVDERGDYDDWIELYNGGDKTIRLAGMYLTDDFTAITKWKIPDTTIAPGGFLVIWADNEVNEGALHANFKLGAAKGEGVGLYDTDVHDNELIDARTFGPQKPDISYGRYPDGENEWQLFTTPTPGSANATGRETAPARK